MKTSQISGFYKLNPKERLQIVKEFAELTDEEAELLQSTGSLKLELADRMIENVIGAIPIPLGIAVNFLINDVIALCIFTVVILTIAMLRFRKSLD